MADKKITGLGELTDSLDPEDLILCVRVTDTSMAGTGTNLKITYENFTAGLGSSLTVGSAITGGTNDRVLYQDASGNLAQDADLTFAGATLTVGGAYPTIGMLTVRSTFSTGLGSSGIKISNIETGKDVVFNVLSGGDLFLSDAAGVGVALGLASRTNPADGSANKAISNYWSIEKNGGSGQCLVCINRSPTDSTQLDIQVDAAGTKGLVLKGAASATANLCEWQKSDATIYSTVSENGYYTTRKNAAPADAELVAGECAMWFDSTDGAAKWKFKGKSANGTVVIGEVALT